MNNRQPPNIVFILIDDLGWKDLGCAGSTYYDTPHLDALASGGMRFLNAYSAAPVCTPSRGAIFSGKSPARTKLTTVFDGPQGPDERLFETSRYRGEHDPILEARHRHVLPLAETILPQPFRAAGYATAFFGKWHIGECPGYYPDQRGFDRAKGYRLVAGLEEDGHFGRSWTPGNCAGYNLKPDDFLPDLLTDDCIQFIRQHRDQPFFAFLSHYIVHVPITPRPEKVPKYRLRTPTDQCHPEYAALVESVDDSMGRVMAELRTLGLEENTLVVFTSDNGGLTNHNYTSNYPLMGGKSFPFEGGIKVPLLMRWPRHIPAGSTCRSRVIGMDFYPTLLAAAGLPPQPAQHVDGKDITPLWSGAEAWPERPLLFHFPHYTHATGPVTVLIENEWKLIHFYNEEEGADLLYHLARDPYEQTDLSNTMPERRHAMRERMNALLHEQDAEFPTPNPHFKPDPNRPRMNRRFTLELALRERREQEARLRNSHP